MHKCIALLIVLCCCRETTAQVALFFNDSAISYKPGSFNYYVDSSHERTINRYKNIKSKLNPLFTNDINLSYDNAMLWLSIPLKSILPASLVRYVMLRNPHINFVNAWLIINDSVVQTFHETGDHLPFASRDFYHPAFVFPISENNRMDAAILLMIDKRNEQINIPIHFLTEEGFIKFNRVNNLLAGLMAGIGIFLFVFNLFLYFNMHERLYVYYGIYILLAFLYIFSDYGYSFMYLFPHAPQLADFTRPMAISFATPIYLLFSIEFLNTKKNIPYLYKWSLRYLCLYVFILFISIIIMPNTGLIRLILIFCMQIFQNLTALIILFIAIASWRKKVLYAGYITFSSLIVITMFTLFMQFVAGYIPDNFFTRNLMNIGFTGEISVLAFALSIRFSNYKLQSEKLLIQVNEQQEQIFKTISNYQENEMSRLSGLLHDSVGAKLSAIRLNLEMLSNNQLLPYIEDISSLANEVRDLSHSLSPLTLQKKGLIEALQQYINMINKNGKLFVQFESIGTMQQTSFQLELLIYRIIQELLQNTIKHANATEAFVQLIIETELISIFVEDNGVGFNQKIVQDGLGFSQIKQLVTFVKGSMLIKTNINMGCQVSIEFPPLSHEGSNTFINS